MLWSSSKLRKTFLDYFKSHGHEVIDSSSITPKGDDSLLFTNSGMVQFKANFLGLKNRFSEVKRACSIQRCIRAGGKHNDLDDVGKDTYHHTFFEMLGNWSFGDYFKEEAIDLAWNFLTKSLNIPKDRLYVTYFGDHNSEIPPDITAKKIWSRYLPESHILKGSIVENFWEMADTGPCGPCTEIHFDRIGNRLASSLVNKNDPDVLEVWNIVFMEYNRTSTGLSRLNRPCVDTGIGFERLLSILNNVRSNYLTDLFVPIFEFIQQEGCLEEYTDAIYGESFEKDKAYRILADHSRTIAVCLYYDVFPSSEGRGYVVRRLLRRSIRYSQEVFNFKNGFLARLVSKAADILGLKLNECKIKYISNEELLFSKTLSRGVTLFKKILSKSTSISGKDAFVLYDTYGFPLDLTKILAEENSIKVDEEGFHDELNKSRIVSRSSRKKNFELPRNGVSTDDSYKYTSNGIESTLLFKSIADELIGCVFDKTCFYYESGGQIGDRGFIDFYESGIKVGKLEVEDTQLINGVIFHIGRLDGNLSTNAKMFFNSEEREKIMKNHTGTHILFYFLRKVLKKENIAQKGSLVEPEKLRFDFSCTRPLELQEIIKIEEEMNSIINEGVPVDINIVKFSEIGDKVTKLDGEEYPEYVRNIVIKGNNDILQDLCGGTHVQNTAKIQKIRIISETGISSNTRRIVAFTGSRAVESQKHSKDLEKSLESKIISEIPLVERCRIQEARKSKMKELELKKAKKINSQLQEVQNIIIISKTETMMNARNSKDITKFRFDGNLFGSKDIKKNIRKIIDIFQKHSINAIVYSVLESHFYSIFPSECSNIEKIIKDNINNAKFRCLDIYKTCEGSISSDKSIHWLENLK